MTDDLRDNLLVKQEGEDDSITIGKETNGTVLDLTNKSGVSRTITGVADGGISQSSKEAVNGSQLYAVGDAVAQSFGGGASYENGEWTAPSFKVIKFNDDGTLEEESYTNVTAAFAGVNSSFTKLRNEIFDNIGQNALLWSDADEAFVALHGKGDEKRKSKLKFLMDGDISEGSTDAITGNQLYSMSNVLAAYLGGGAGYKDGQWIAPEFNVVQFNNDGHFGENQSYNTVSDAFDAVSGSMSNMNDRINGIKNDLASVDDLGWNESVGAYDASHKGEQSKITNVADGKVEKDSKDVVNGGQLWETNQKVTQVEQRVDNIDMHIKDIESTITNNVVSYDTQDGNKTNTITLVGGNESDPVLIDNVADGKIQEGSKEAINGGQLYTYTKEQMDIVLNETKKYTDDQINILVNDTFNEAKQYTDMKFEALSYGVESVRKEARQAAAIGLAVSSLRYDDTPGKLSISLGSGMWRSQSAFALGAGYTSEDGNIRSNLSVTSAGGHWGVGLGVTFTLN
ncbi:Vomp family autotransporter [Bartonella sp. B17]